MTAFYVLEPTADIPEITQVYSKYEQCESETIAVERVGNVSVRFTRKRQLVDFSCPPGVYLASQRVFDLFTINRLSGWRQGVVNIDFASQIRTNSTVYSELIIVGYTRDYARVAGLTLKGERCGHKIYRIPQQGLPMPEACWDGSDIFLIEELPGICVVTEATQQVIKNNELTGVEIIPIDEWCAPLWAQVPDDEKTVMPKDETVWPPLKRNTQSPQNEFNASSTT